MIKKIMAFYTGFALLFWVLLATLTIYRLYEVKGANTNRALNSFESLRLSIEASMIDSASLDTPDFRNLMRGFFGSSATPINALIVYSYDTGVEYLKARSARYLGMPAAVGGELRSIPRFSYNSFTQTRIGSSITIPNRDSFIVEGIYGVLNEGDVLPVLRDTLISLGAFITATMLVLLLAGLAERRHEAQQPVSQGSPPGPGGRPGAREADTVCQASLEKRLTLELERAAYNEQDCALAIITADGLIEGGASFKRLRAELISKLAFEDLIFPYGGNSFAVILVNTNLDQAIKLIEEFQRKVETSLPNQRAGLTARNGRLVEGRRLLIEAEKALEKTGKGRDAIVGFRPDPGKYRHYVSARASTAADSRS